MTGLTPEQRELVAQAGTRPVHLEDPETHQAYVLVRAEVYEQIRSVVEPRSDRDVRIAEGIRRSQQAFFRDLPGSPRDRRLKGRYGADQGDERIGIAKDDEPPIRECQRRGLKRDAYDILVIEPQSPDPEEIDDPSFWYDIRN
jgi:hypothetical protein